MTFSTPGSCQDRIGPIILGLETSCDETAAAIVDGRQTVLASVLASQHDVHGPYGGVVPELAARRHTETIEAIVQEAMRRANLTWSDLHAVAVTRGPGLAGALLVGVSYGKAIAYAAGLRLIAVHHLEGHLASAWLEDKAFPTPCVMLVVSGGHTHLYLAHEEGTYELLGRTLDDAAGEAFDKGAQMLGLGFPGGPALDRLAREGTPEAVRFPRPYLKRGGLDFSFSGLKTALLYYLRDCDQSHRKPALAADIAASYQEAIVDVLLEKAFRAVRRSHVKALGIVGGVSANSRLRAAATARARATGVRLVMPSPVHCTDNAAMIAAAACRRYVSGQADGWDLEASASWDLPSASDVDPAQAVVLRASTT